MVVSVIQSQISAAELTLRPGYSVATLTVEVVNNSDRQASFHILLAATGDDGQQQRRWYRLTPMTSSKVPPGTQSLYTVNIVDTPLPGFVGLANVTVRIISPELQSEERHVLRLRVEPGIDVVPFKVSLPTQTPQDYPGETVEIPARVHNTSRYPLTLMLSCPGLETWLTESSPTRLNLRPNRWHDVLMVCQIPADLALSHSRDYPFQILVVDDDGNTATADGTLEVLPLGYFELAAERTYLTIPATQKWLPDWHTHATQTQLQLINQSNLRDTLRVKALPPPDSPSDLPDNPTQDSPNPKPSDQKTRDAPYQVTLTPEIVPLDPGQTRSVETTIQVKRPWLGWVKTFLIDIQARLDASHLDLRNDTETLHVRVTPIIPRWLQALAILLLGGAIAGLWFFQTYRQHHRQLVSSVQFNGTGTRIISGSSDQTLRQWQVLGRRLRPIQNSIQLDKAVRVLRYRPVDNNQLAVGLENGEIQLWNLLKPSTQAPRTLINPTGRSIDRDDRVMALAPTTDARYLFSGYGSGQVAQWYIDPDSEARDLNPLQPTRQLFIPELAIYDIALIDPDDQTLAIAGRYNKLLLWHWPQTTAQNAVPEPPSPLRDAETAAGDRTALVSIDYPSGGQNDYITSLATAEQQPFRLAAADNQGRITLWDLENCLDQPDRCTLLDQWQPDPETAIRAIAFSADGCYVASASDNGQITLWPLTHQGRRLTKYLQGQQVKTLNTRLNSIDIKALETDILIVSGAEDQRVRLHRVNHSQQICQR